MSGKPASHSLLLLPRRHFESIKALHAQARARTNNKQYLNLQINIMAGRLKAYGITGFQNPCFMQARNSLTLDDVKNRTNSFEVDNLLTFKGNHCEEVR